MEPTEKIKLLLVDDHKWVREGFKMALESFAEFTVIGEAADGEEAVAMVKKLKPDIIIMDINMPRVNGIEAVNKIRMFNDDVKIIILTMQDNERFIFEALSEGVNGFIYKDADIAELKEAILQVAAGDDYLNKEVTKKIMQFYSGKKVNNIFEESPAKSPLSKREIEIIKLVSEGLTSKEIAERIFLSPHTVIKHRKNILKKLNLKSMNEAVKYAIMNELI